MAAFRRCAAEVPFDEGFIGSGYEDIDWTGLEFPRQKFEELQALDRATGEQIAELFDGNRIAEIDDIDMLEEFFYQRGFDEAATTAISLEEVLGAVERVLNS